MMRWLLTRLIIVLAVVAVAGIYTILGYSIDWPTLIYTLIVVAVIEAVREGRDA